MEKLQTGKLNLKKIRMVHRFIVLDIYDKPAASELFQFCALCNLFCLHYSLILIPTYLIVINILLLFLYATVRDP